MKKITIALCIISLLLIMVPINASAEEMKQLSERPNTIYGTITVMESKDWQTKPNGDKYIQQVYSVTKTIGNYVYITVVEKVNVKITSIQASANFEKVKEIKVGNGVQVVLKAKSPVTAKTELMTVLADIDDPENHNCDLSYSPEGLSCVKIDDLYIDKNGNEITKEQYAEICDGVTPPPPDEPDIPDNPKTGNPIPYMAVAGGLIAIAGVYFYSRKSNKIYKI